MMEKAKGSKAPPVSWPATFDSSVVVASDAGADAVALESAEAPAGVASAGPASQTIMRATALTQRPASRSASAASTSGSVARIARKKARILGPGQS